MNSILLLAGITLMYSTPLVFGALGGVLSERSGVVNIGIEGMMTIGAVVAVAATYFTNNPWIGFVAAGAAGGLFAVLHALASVTFKADQNVSGIALNLLGPGLALFMARVIWDGSINSPTVPTLPKVVGNVDITVVLGLVACAIVWFVLYRTKWGLHVRACGEHPAAADTMGIHVNLIRFVCVVLSGVMAGFGGASITLAIVSQFSQTAVAGQGFIALAAVIFGKWTPHGAYGACLLFGFAQALVIMLGGGASPIPSDLLSCLPYVLTIVVLVLFVGRATAPKADGTPYEKGQRG